MDGVIRRNPLGADGYVMEDRMDRTGDFHFLEAPGGCGKTYLMNAIMRKLRSLGYVVLAVAASGIAATLLEGGMCVLTYQT